MATRRWLRLLLNQYPRLRVVALVDGDPHGLDILATYKNGSAAMSYSAADLCIPELCWLGVRVEDLSAFGVPKHSSCCLLCSTVLYADIRLVGIHEQCLLPLTKHDTKLAKRLLKSRKLRSVHPCAEQDLHGMLKRGAKAEIECFHTICGGLPLYLQTKLFNNSNGEGSDGTAQGMARVAVLPDDGQGSR